MSDQDKQEAADRARVAAAQAKHAVKNTGRAAKAAAKVGADKAVDAADDFYDAAKDKAPEVLDEAKVIVSNGASATESVASDAAFAAKRHASRINPFSVAAITGDTGVGLLATTVMIYSGIIAYNKFSAAFGQRGRIVR